MVARRRRKEPLYLKAKDSSARTGISRNIMTMLAAASAFHILAGARSASALRAVTVAAAAASRQLSRLSRAHSLRRPSVGSRSESGRSSRYLAKLHEVCR
jgi:hypothetical protein